MTQDQQTKLREQRDQKYKGVNNSHKVLMLHNGMKIDRHQPQQREMDFVNSQKWNMEKIMAIFKVPKAILGM